jgi:multicomponent Na+:H+ antiporter subunit E
MGLPIEYSKTILFISSVFTAYFLGIWLNLIPKTIKFHLSVISYLPWLITEIIKSSISVIKILIRKDMNIQPVFEWIDSEQKNDLGTVVYANSITLTPGTVTLDVQNNLLLVHALEQNSIDNLKHSPTSMAKRINKIITN